MTEETKKRDLIYGWLTIAVFVLIPIVINYLLNYYKSDLPIIKENTMFQILIQTNITFLGFYLLCMTFILKKFEDSPKEYNQIIKKFERHYHNEIETYSQHKELFKEAAKRLFYKTPLFHTALKVKNKDLSVKDIEELAEGKTLDNYIESLEKGMGFSKCQEYFLRTF